MRGREVWLYFASEVARRTGAVNSRVIVHGAAPYPGCASIIAAAAPAYAAKCFQCVAPTLASSFVASFVASNTTACGMSKQQSDR